MTNNLEQARKYILGAPLAISGRDGHGTTFKVACDLIHGFTLTVEEAQTLMSEYNERLDEMWTQAELRHKIEDASNKVSRRPTGYLLVRHEPYKRTPPASPAGRTIWKIVPKAVPTGPPAFHDDLTMNVISQGCAIHKRFTPSSAVVAAGPR